MNFKADVSVARIEDVGRFIAEVRIHCTECNTPFQFLGMPPGFNYLGPTVSIAGLDANLPIYPQGAELPPVPGVIGYSFAAPAGPGGTSG